ncbi:hypothetical protein [Tolumonas osonensis]|uniref:Uncharacterized protein n=1 Tax=Tolumonas osonensis TaxID=675874 RepID=A0A841GS23_9GAMM|nr:hypothetical protein [Tolumonas osonensis]MBB6056533.1 hypothetical protein [Tolumonas osonensis]
MLNYLLADKLLHREALHYTRQADLDFFALIAVVGAGFIIHSLWQKQIR